MTIDTIWELETASAQLAVAACGAALVSWQVTGADGSRQELHDGYRNAEELAGLDGVRGAVLAPWSNRLREGKYRFQGKEYEVGPELNADPQAIHGLVVNRVFTLLEKGDNFLELAAGIAPSPGYPWALSVRVRYSVESTEQADAKLGFRVTVKNVGMHTAPVGIGWHPYFQLGEVSDLEAHISATARVLTGENLIPLPDLQAFQDLSAPPQLSLADGPQDTAYTQLDASAGYAYMRLQSRTGGQALELRYLNAPSWQQGEGVFYIYTGEDLQIRPRESVALEPCTFMTDAMNRLELEPVLALAPGMTRQLQAEVLYWRQY